MHLHHPLKCAHLVLSLKERHVHSFFKIHGKATKKTRAVEASEGILVRAARGSAAAGKGEEAGEVKRSWTAVQEERRKEACPVGAAPARAPHSLTSVTARPTTQYQYLWVNCVCWMTIWQAWSLGCNSFLFYFNLESLCFFFWTRKKWGVGVTPGSS